MIVESAEKNGNAGFSLNSSPLMTKLTYKTKNYNKTFRMLFNILKVLFVVKTITIC